jgi:hypothetical protein
LNYWARIAPQGRLRTSRQSYCISTIHGGHSRLRGNDKTLQTAEN